MGDKQLALKCEKKDKDSKNGSRKTNECSASHTIFRMLKEAHREMRKDGLWMKKQDRLLCAASPIPKHHHFPWTFWTKT